MLGSLFPCIWHPESRGYPRTTQSLPPSPLVPTAPRAHHAQDQAAATPVLIVKEGPDQQNSIVLGIETFFASQQGQL